MANQKRDYIIRGSEDGNIAVKTNMKAAYEAATGYMVDNECQPHSYKECCKSLNKKGWYAVQGSNEGFHSSTECEITAFYLESK